MVNYNSKERQNMHFYGKFCSFIIIATSSEQGFRAKLTKANLLRRVHQTLFSDLFSLKMRLLEAFIQYYICLFSLSLYLSLSLRACVCLNTRGLAMCMCICADTCVYSVHYEEVQLTTLTLKGVHALVPPSKLTLH